MSPGNHDSLTHADCAWSADLGLNLQRGGENDTRDCQSASTSAVCCQWPRPTQQLDVSFQSARCAFLTSSFDDEGSNFDFSEEEGLASESSLGPCPHEAHAVAWDGYLQTCTDGGETAAGKHLPSYHDLTLLPHSESPPHRAACERLGSALFPVAAASSSGTGTGTCQA